MEKHSKGGSQAVLKRFIEAYASEEQLWNPASPDYCDRYKRKQGLLYLLQVYRAMYPSATIADVRKKINTLRSNFRRELQKVKSSAVIGDDNLYQPTSWVFYALYFLADTVSPPPVLDVEIKEEKENACEDICPESAPGAHQPPSDPACDFLPQDHILNISKVWAFKLGSLQPRQRKLAELVINRVLSEAELGTLTRGSVVFSQDPDQAD